MATMYFPVLEIINYMTEKRILAGSAFDHQAFLRIQMWKNRYQLKLLSE